MTTTPLRIAIMADLQPQGERLDAFQEQLDEALGLASARGVTGLAIAGDIFEVANIGDSHAGTGAVIEAVCAPLRHWLGQGPRREVLAIRGNHDADTDAEADALAALEYLGAPGQVRVERRPSVVYWHGINVACLPWRWYVADESRTGSAELERLIADVSKDDDVATHDGVAKFPKLLLAHAPVIGASQGQGRAYQGGGAWALTQEDCLKAGRFFDRVALGDFHMRQPDLCGPGKGGYVGALWQMNFAHCGEPQGFEVWEPETGRVEWVEVNASPTHHKHVVESEEELMAVGDLTTGDRRRVWIVADGFAPSKTAREACAKIGVRLTTENLKAKVERVARVESAPALAASGNLDGLLCAALGTLSPAPEAPKRERVRQLMAQLIEAQPKLLRAGMDGDGEPARAASPVLYSVSMRGLARHAEPVELNLAEAAPLVAVVGRNGAGKSSLVGGLYAALFGTLPGYRGSLYEATTAGGDGEAWVEAVFGVPDPASGQMVTYMARRELRVTAKTTEQERYLYRLADGAEVLIAGPKEGPYRAAVERLVGTAETALATWFLAGSREGDLVELTPAQRRAALGSLMGLDVIEAIADAAGEEAKARAAQVKYAAASLPSLAAAEEALAVAQARASEALASRNENAALVESLRADVDAATKRWEEARAEVERINSQAQARAALVSKRESLEETIKTKTERLESRRAELKLAEAARERVAGSTGPGEQLAEAKTKRAKVAEAAAWAEQLTVAKARLESASEALHSARAKLTEAETGDAGKPTLESIKAEGVAAANAVTVAEGHLAECESKRVSAQRAESEAKAQANAAANTLAALKRRAEKTPATPFGAEACAPCPLMAEWANLPAQVAEAEKALTDAAARRDKATDHLADVQANYETAANAVKEATAARQALRDKYAARQTEVAAIERLRDDVGRKAGVELAAREQLAKWSTPPDDLAGIDPAEVEREIARLEKELAAFDADRALAKTESGLALAVQQLADELRQVRFERERVVAELDATPFVKGGEPDVAAKDERETKAALTAARQSLRTATDEATRLAGAVGATEAQLAAAIKARDAAKDANERHERLIADESDWRLLSLAMGPTGAQGIVIEAASLDFEREAGAIVSRLMDRPLTITLAMQALDAKTAKTNGECRLLMAEADGAPAARELAQWSGGERDAAAIAIRLSIARWVAASRSLALRSLYIDEVAARMHPEVAGRLVDLLGEMVADGRLAQVIAITPNPVLAARMPSRVEVCGNALGYTTATLTGGGK